MVDYTLKDGLQWNPEAAHPLMLMILTMVTEHMAVLFQKFILHHLLLVYVLIKFISCMLIVYAAIRWKSKSCF